MDKLDVAFMLGIILAVGAVFLSGCEYSRISGPDGTSQSFDVDKSDSTYEGGISCAVYHSH